MLLRSLGTLFCTLLFAAHAGAATCGGDFNAFLSAMAREAAAAGVSRSVLDGAFAGLMPDNAVLAFDRRQRGTFRKSFEEYAATRVIPARIKRAKQLMQRHAALLARIERQFGVPATLLMAIWTLESDNGTGDMGKLPVIRTLATLAHDCRRSVPDVLASTANLLKTNGWRAGAPFGEGTANFDVMSEWNRSVVYRKTMVLFAERLAEP